MGSNNFEVRLMPGLTIREPTEGEAPRVPPPPANPPSKTPPPPPETQEMEVDQRTPDPKEAVQGETPNGESDAKPSVEKEAAMGVADEPVAVEEADEAATTEGFAAEIQRETDALLNRHEVEEEVEVVNLEGDQLGSNEEAKDQTVEVPSPSLPSFQTFRFEEMGFHAPFIPIPSSVRETIWGRHREEVAAFFGDFSGLSEVDQAREWSLKATARMGEPN
ncbi:protein SCARECROW 1-like [Chenopodium quinoa]|uniref:protein SCARECROW 1-like n=1 Tax=Chenopodium quinoa TaxID=63459 RepID=UPI000B77B69E|nr:protein SCARECROW 1-like [Chenopodium quinoa]